jgi:chromosome segregation ATPase
MGHLISFFSGTGKKLHTEDRPVADELAKIGLKVGSENEALRNLLIEIGRGIGGLDDLKEGFAKLADPLDQALRALERETSDNVSLRVTLQELRTSHEALRSEFKELGKKLTAKGTECEGAQGALILAQQSIKTLQLRETERASELESARAKLSELESQLARETDSVSILTDHKRSLTDRVAAANKQIIAMEAAITSMEEKLVLVSDENRLLQASVKQVVGENSSLSRRLNESATSLQKARLEIKQTKSALDLAEAEYAKLTAVVDEANDRHQVATRTVNVRLEAASSRTIAAEKLLAELRQNLLARAEEVSALQSKLAEVTIARGSNDKMIELLKNDLQAKERQLQGNEQLRLKQVERCDDLEKVGKATAGDLARTQSLAQRVSQLEAEASRDKSEKSIEEFRSQLERERLERAVAEGALQKTRSNYLDLQRRFDEYVKFNGAEKGTASQQLSPKNLPLAQGQGEKRSMPGDTAQTEGDVSTLTGAAETVETD